MYIMQPFKYTVTKLGQHKYTVAIAGRVFIWVCSLINILRVNIFKLNVINCIVL